MTRPVITVLLGDPRLPDRNKPGGRFTPNDFDQVLRLQSALEELDDYRFEYCNDHQRLLDDFRRQPPAFALNFCDTGFRNEAALELHVASYLEMLGIPYSGSGPVALGLCYDKALVRALAQSVGIPVPREDLLRPGEPLPQIHYPAFIKPNRGDGSVGITTASVVNNAAEATAYVEQLRATLPTENLIIQEFLAGDEYGIGIIGNPGDGFILLPVLEVDYSALDPALPRLLDYSSKTDPESPYWNDICFRQAGLDADTQQRLKDYCQALFARLGLRDYGRFDFRADASGEIKLMEVNPNPAWCWDGKLAHMASHMGEGHSGLLRMIIEAARKRYRLGA
ncbi:MAG TPA: D-alanine--D-alanine ligase [Gammaproteobacteria bacterium]|nr:D-alanine--D-alanine ligase [Gammaproteobacteria bacterium]